MVKSRAPLSVLLLWASLVTAMATPQEKLPRIEATNTTEASTVAYNLTTGIAIASNGVAMRYLAVDPSSNAVIEADVIRANTNTGDIFAEGSVRFQRNDQTWVGPQAHYNFITGAFDTDKFRTGRYPIFASGEGLKGDLSNKVYTATNALVTPEDYNNPLEYVRASKLTMVPGKYVEARNATLHIAGVPVFWFPYLKRDLTKDPNHIDFTPGYRGAFGPFLLTTYTWVWDTNLSGAVHGDWREKRGFGVGPDANLRLPDIGEAKARYYYAHDNEPGLDPFTSKPIPSDRQRAYFSFYGNPVTNLSLRAQAAWQTDPFIVRDFFESEYRQNFQPRTYFDITKAWQNWSLDFIAQPRVNAFYETVERLPEARLTGFRQQILDTPLFYESDTSAGYYRRLFANTNAAGTNFYAARADTFHQILLPMTFFGWLNVVPDAGGRITYYSQADGPGATTTNQSRGVFNTGAEVSFKLSRLWKEAKSGFWDVDGVRHIIEPTANYVYVPSPNVHPASLPQFDYAASNTLRLPPIDFPADNSIDSIDSENTVRLGLNNRVQTKRNGELDDLLNWSVYTDWRLQRGTNLYVFSDLFSDLELKPRTWLTLGSFIRYDSQQARFNLTQSRLTLQPNQKWSWSLGHFYLRDGTFFGEGNNLVTSTFFYRLNENWGARLQHYYDIRRGVLQEQDYALYRDMRSWTAALNFRVLDSLAGGLEYGVSFTFSFKSFPRFKPGADTVNATSLLGY
jgi:lipopolysaccharide assembly outer membrane protein LptD (OstA)